VGGNLGELDRRGATRVLAGASTHAAAELLEDPGVDLRDKLGDLGDLGREQVAGRGLLAGATGPTRHDKPLQ
jgi:hypothetical protein